MVLVLVALELAPCWTCLVQVQVQVQVLVLGLAGLHAKNPANPAWLSAKRDPHSPSSCSSASGLHVLQGSRAQRSSACSRDGMVNVGSTGSRQLNSCRPV